MDESVGNHKNCGKKNGYNAGINQLGKSRIEHLRELNQEVAG